MANASADRGSSGHKKLGGAELVARLGQMVTTLIAENRRLQREIERLRERASAKPAPSSRRKPRPAARPGKVAARARARPMPQKKRAAGKGKAAVRGRKAAPAAGRKKKR